MRKIFFLLAAVLALAFAVPVVASPPGELPSVEAMSLSASYSAPSIAIDKEPAIVAAPAARLEGLDYIRAAVAPALLVVAYYVVAMLAGLMRAALSASNRLSPAHYDPRDRMHGLARDQTALA